MTHAEEGQDEEIEREGLPAQECRESKTDGGKARKEEADWQKLRQQDAGDCADEDAETRLASQGGRHAINAGAPGGRGSSSR